MKTLRCKFTLNISRHCFQIGVHTKDKSFLSSQSYWGLQNKEDGKYRTLRCIESRSDMPTKKNWLSQRTGGDRGREEKESGDYRAREMMIEQNRNQSTWKKTMQWRARRVGGGERENRQVGAYNGELMSDSLFFEKSRKYVGRKQSSLIAHDNLGWTPFIMRANTLFTCTRAPHCGPWASLFRILSVREEIFRARETICISVLQTGSFLF